MLKVIPLLIIYCLLSCQGSETAKLIPDLTTGLTGTYSVISYRQGTCYKELPSGAYIGVYNLVKIDLTHVNAKLTLAERGKVTLDSTNIFKLRRDGADSNRYKLDVDAQEVGTITPSTIDILTTSPVGVITEIKAERW